MKKTFTFVLTLILGGVSAWSQELPYWQNTQVSSVNAQTRRTEVIYYADRADALSKGFRESENYENLNGVWDFKYFDDYHAMAVPAEWDRIQVPGNWEIQGHGVAIYTNIPYDFCPSNPQPPQLPDVFPGALYHRSFTVPAGWKGRKVFLNLCGTKSGTYVYVNGREIGYNEDSKDLARFDITDALKEGENDLLLKIYRYSTGSYLECQDFWRISGIERDVYLSSEKVDTGFDFNVVSTLTEDLSTGIFKLRMHASAPTEVSYELLDKDGSTVADASFEFNGNMATVTDSIPGVRRWSAETPELYTLLLKVNGEYTRFHVGFRRTEIKTVKDGDRDVKAFFFNGQPVKFKGVNLHEHNPYTGHYITRENILEDLRLMKLCNINAIRTCHYPQPREFYELCDSLGFYVYDEANIESHGMGYNPDRTLGNNPEWLQGHLDRTVNMYRRTANYPSVNILSLGNEAGNGVNFYATYALLKEFEKDGQNRPVVYERAEHENNTDFLNPMYPDTDWLRKMGESYSAKPIVLCEYSHAMGNSNGSLDWQWEQFYGHIHLQGGFIWDWVDQGFYDKEKGWTYGGDYGTGQPSDGNFLCNGLVNPDRDPHPGFYEVKHVYQDVSITPVDAEKGIFQIFNRHYFSSLDGYTVKYWVERDGKRPFWWFTHKLHFTTAPQTAEQFKVKLPRMRKAGEYRIFFEVSARSAMPLVDKGTIVACDEALLKDTSAPKVRKARGKLEFTEGDTQIVVRGAKVELVFDKADGTVKSWKVGGRDVVDPSFGIKPNFWRAGNDNDYGCGAPWRTRRFKTPGKPENVTAALQEDGSVRITVTGKDVRAKEEYTVFGDGSIKLAVATAPAEGLPAGEGYHSRVEIPRLGIRFRVAGDSFRYFGRGPVENYWDRNSGTFKRIWKSTASAEYYPYVRPQETGHHTEVSWLEVDGVSVISDQPFEFNALRQSIEDLDSEEATDKPFQWNYFRADEDHSDEAGAFRVRRQTHVTDVPVRDFTEVCVDYKMTGVGGYDSWHARPEPDRTLWADTAYTYSFTLIPGKL